MRKVLTSATCLLVAVGLLLGGSPARAGELSVADPKGDATAVGDVESTPRPSDPELDILAVRYSSDAKELRIDMKMAKIGQPVGGIGFTYRLNFTHGATDYQFLYQVLAVPGIDQPAFILRSGATGDDVACRCSGKVNGKTATLEIRADIASLARGMKAFDSAAPPIGPGTKFTALTNTADRIVGCCLIAADHANPPAPATFTF